MPVRLTELVKKYPYGSSDNDLLSRPRFSTRRYEAMLVRVETQLTTQRKPEHNPSQLISDAFEAEVSADEQEHKELWEQIKAMNDSKGDTSPADGPNFGRVFADETIRFLSLFPDETSESGSQSYSLFKKSSRKRSLSLNDQDLPVASPTANNNGHAKNSTDPTGNTATKRPATRDWTQFSTCGFAESGTLETRLAATLIDKDVISSPSKNPRLTIGTASSRSMKSPISPAAKEDLPLVSSFKVAQFSSVQLDEAFVDFWSDALTDPISSNWPPFVLCKVKPGVVRTTKSGKKVDWLIIERSYINPAVPELSDSGHQYGRRATSPRPSIASQGTFSSAKKRFSLFSTSGSRTSFDKRLVVPSRKKASSLSNATKALGKSHSAVRVGEMGEVLREEDEKEASKASPPSPKPSKSSEVVRKSLEAVKKSISSGKKSAEQALSVSGSSAPLVQGPTPRGVSESELAVASAASAAAVAASVIASNNAPKTEEAKAEAKSSEQTPVSPSPVEAAQPVEEAPLETVVEVTEEPAAPVQPESDAQRAAVESVTVEEVPTAVEPVPLKPATEEEKTTAEEVQSGTDEEEKTAPTVVESELPQPVEVEAEPTKVDAVVEEPVAEPEGPSERPSGNLAQQEAKVAVEGTSNTDDAEQH